MFQECSSLIELNISNFNTKNVNEMSSMFEGCSSLKKLNASNFNANNNELDICGMFKNCSSLTELDLSNFNTNKFANMNQMFYGCSSLKELKYNFKVTDSMFMTFAHCPNELILKILNEYKDIRKESLVDPY